jgi:hypothetical protein
MIIRGYRTNTSWKECIEGDHNRVEISNGCCSIFLTHPIASSHFVEHVACTYGKKCPYKSYGKNQWSALKSKENIKGSGEDTLQLMELVVYADTALSAVGMELAALQILFSS